VGVGGGVFEERNVGIKEGRRREERGFSGGEECCDKEGRRGEGWGV
jgi:hypothetical protein